MLNKKQNIIAILLLLLTSSMSSAKDLVMYFYQQTPPFETTAQQGYFYDLVSYIDNKDLTNHYSLQFMPRELINRLIDKGRFHGVVVGGNPAWFNDNKKEKYLWSISVFEDANEVISDLAFPFEYTGLDSLIGLTIGGIRGHYYVGLEPLIKQGLVYRDDVSRVTQNLKKATSGRVDLSIINRSFLQYYLLDHKQDFHISKQPHAIHAKQLLFTKGYESYYLLINDILKKAKLNGDLDRLINPYR